MFLKKKMTIFAVDNLRLASVADNYASFEKILSEGMDVATCQGTLHVTYHCSLLKCV